MAISRAQLAKELEPGLNALFGMEYDRYDAEHAEMHDLKLRYRRFQHARHHNGHIPFRIRR